MERNAPNQEQERKEGCSKYTHSFYLDTYLRESSVSSLGAVKRRDPHKSMHTGLRLAPSISQWSFQKEEDRTQSAAVLAPGFLYCRGGKEGGRLWYNCFSNRKIDEGEEEREGGREGSKQEHTCFHVKFMMGRGPFSVHFSKHFNPISAFSPTSPCLDF